AARAMDQVSPAAAEQGIELRSTLETASVRGDQSLLERMVANLLENAVGYNVSPGWGDEGTGNHSDQARLRVHNRGPHLAADRVPSLFEPLRRLSRDRTSAGRGSGLGLSIVRSVARAHGGDATARPRASGGLTVEVELPQSALQMT